MTCHIASWFKEANVENSLSTRYCRSLFMNHALPPSVPIMRGMIEKLRNAFSANPSFYRDMENGDSDDAYRYRPSPFSIKRIESDPTNGTTSTTTNPRGLVGESPFLATVAEDLTNGEVSEIDDVSVSVRYNNAIHERGASSVHSSAPSQPRRPLMTAGSSEAASEPGRKRPMSLSDRLAQLRPGYRLDIPEAPLSVSSHDRSSALSPKYSTDLLQYQCVPVMNGKGIVRGPLSEQDWMYYKNFCGTWVSDEAHSDGIGDLLSTLEMQEGTSPQRWLDVMSLQMDREHIQMWRETRDMAKLDETRPWSGSRVPSERRDLRNGGAECWVERYPQGLIFRVRWTGDHAADIYEYLELTADFMHMVTRQDVFRGSGHVCQRRVVWARRLIG